MSDLAKACGGLSLGVFDSGIGGLTVVRELLRWLPGERIVYFGDTARAPYGNKSPRTLIHFALENARFLQSRHIKLLMVACNSSSAYCLPVLRRALCVPVVGVILAGARAAARKTRGRVGIIGTHATIASGAYQRALQRLAPRAKVFVQACPLFVPLAEEGWFSGGVTRAAAKRYLACLRSLRVDTLVLGCTHYPLLRSVIADIMGRKVTLVDSAREAAQEVATVLKSKGLFQARRRVSFLAHEFYVSDLPGRFSELAHRFLGRPLSRVGQVQPTEWR